MNQIFENCFILIKHTFHAKYQKIFQFFLEFIISQRNIISKINKLKPCLKTKQKSCQKQPSPLTQHLRYN